MYNETVSTVIGFVAMPFNDFLRLFLSSPVLPGAVKDKIITAATLYKGMDFHFLL